MLVLTSCESQGRKPVTPAAPVAAKPAVTDITAQDYVMPTMPHARVTLVDAYGGKHPVDAEVAYTRDQRTRGLMWRTELAEGTGMLFIFQGDQWLSFWMKNTLIPLDMIFVRADGTIARIAADTVPYSLAPVSSGEPVAAVLEIAGGRAAELGIAEDDTVMWTDKP